MLHSMLKINTSNEPTLAKNIYTARCVLTDSLCADILNEDRKNHLSACNYKRFYNHSGFAFHYPLSNYEIIKHFKNQNIYMYVC